jgi:3-phenylpropionate/cinnamic acid dioxygenase small subunit
MVCVYFESSTTIREDEMRFKAGMIGAMAWLAAGTASAATPYGQDALAQWKDRQAIEVLLVQYSTGLDTLQPDLYASCFTDDAEFGPDGQARKGRAKIREVITDLIASRDKRAKEGTNKPPLAMHHVITNGVIELVDAGHARHHSYWMTVITGADNKITIAAQGRYEDQMVKQNGKWLFSSRKILR